MRVVLLLLFGVLTTASAADEPDFRALVAEAQQTAQQRRQAERAQAQQTLAEAVEAFQEVGPSWRTPDAATRTRLATWYERFHRATVVIDGETRAVPIPYLDEVRIVLNRRPPTEGRQATRVNYRWVLPGGWAFQRIEVGGRELWVGETEVTQAQWAEVMGSNPSYFDGCGPTCPVESVTMLEAVAFANKLSAAHGLPHCYEDYTLLVGCKGYRLPRLAEWRAMVQAGGALQFPGSNDPKKVSRHHDNSEQRTWPVGCLAPNAAGIYDLAGNVAEWLWPDGDQPLRVETTASTRVHVIGGTWAAPAEYGATRAEPLQVWTTARSDEIGFRLVREGE